MISGAKHVPHKAALPVSWPRRIAWSVLALYAIYAASTLDFSFERVARGAPQAVRLLGRMWPPNHAPDMLEMLGTSLVESIQIAILSTTIGLALALPLGLLAARNLMPVWVVWPTRMLVAMLRSFNVLIVAILFVKAIGFGALAGILAMIVGSMSFAAKFFAEAIEEVNLKQVEAVRATGASFANTLIMGILPQVAVRFAGFSSYQLDSNLRNSTLVGIVGGGGMGTVLLTAFQRFDYDFVTTIVLATMVVVMISELVTGRVRILFL